MPSTCRVWSPGKGISNRSVRHAELFVILGDLGLELAFAQIRFEFPAIVDLAEFHPSVARDEAGGDLAFALKLNRQPLFRIDPHADVQRMEGEEEIRDFRVDTETSEKTVVNVGDFKSNRLDALHLPGADLAVVAGGPEPLRSGGSRRRSRATQKATQRSLPA